ncbi:MAG: hypothetical protein Q8P93_00040 [bacterium]|nr:hypothetical protein [bacterium]
MKRLIIFGLLAIGAVLIFSLFLNNKLAPTRSVEEEAVDTLVDSDAQKTFDEVIPTSQGEKETVDVVVYSGNEDNVDVSRYSRVMPVSPGTKWTYEGKRVFYNPSASEVQEVIAQKVVEVKGIKKEDDTLRVFTHAVYKNDPDFNERDDSFLVSESGYGFNGKDIAPFPLAEGQRLTNYDPERTDGYYDDWVTAVNLKDVLGTQRKCYDISYRGLPDESLAIFCEGVGYIQDRYEHNGTPNEWDYRLIRIEDPALEG